jgi:hypothetical protein
MAACGQAESPPVAELPFDLRHGLIWVSVTVPQQTEPLNFLLDSGAGTSVINLPTALRLGLKLGKSVSVRGVESEAQGYWPLRVPAKAGDIPLPGEYLSVDLGKLSEACQCGVDGLLGVDFFRGRVVEIDFAARRIRLLRSSEPGPDASVAELKVGRQAMLAPIRLDAAGARWVRVDTGCSSALHWVEGASRTAGAKKTVSIGLTELRLPTTTTRMHFAGLSLGPIPTTLHAMPLFAGEAGLLGNGFLTHFDRVIIDARAGRLILESLRQAW